MTTPTPLPIVRDLSEGATLVLPVPTDCALPDLSGAPGFTAAYTYTEAAGGIVALIIRMDRTDKAGKRCKQILPLTLWHDPAQGLVWAWRGLPEDRPMYRLSDLHARPDAPILIVEGEKCADVAARVFGKCVVVTWMGGCSAIDKTDFGSLKGREIIIMPDHDAPGLKACDALVDKCRALEARRIQILDIGRVGAAVSGKIPDGYDIADAIADGLSSSQLHNLISNDPRMLRDVTAPPAPDAPDSSPPAGDRPDNGVEDGANDAGVGDFAPASAADAVAPARSEDPQNTDIIARLNRTYDTDLTLPDGFTMNSDGLWRHDVDRRGNPVSEFVASPFAVIARTRTGPGGAGWGYLVALLPPTGRWKMIVVPATALVSEAREMISLLAAEGVTIPHSRAGRQALIEYVGHTPTTEIAEVVTQPGWSGDSYCLPGQIVQPPGCTRRVLFDLGDQEHRVAVGGDPVAWQRLAQLAEGNSRATFAICVAFAAVLLRPLNEEVSVFHIFGLSSLGKTTLLFLAISVWGKGSTPGFLRSWLSTSNGLEGIATQHNDMLLALDELGQVEPDALGNVIYMIANETGKARADKTGRLRAAATWKTIVLSSGEVTLGQHMQAGKLGSRGRLLGGIAARAVDIPIETSSGSGRSYETLHGYTDEVGLTEQIALLSGKSYGHAGPAFLGHLVQDRDTHLTTARRIIDGFLADVVTADDDAQVRRVARRFGVVAAAGALATAFGVVPWAEGAAIEAVKTCFGAWRDARGTGASEDERDAIRILKRFFEMHGGSRFEAIDDRHEDDVPDRLDDRPVHARCGYRTTIPDKDQVPRTVYYVTREAWRMEVCNGRDGDLVARIARKHGALIPGEGTRLQRKQRLPDYPNGTRVYAIQPDLLP